MKDLRGMRAVVTGGTRGLGLGLGIVEALAVRGAEVTAVGRDAAHAHAAWDAGAAVRVGDAADMTLMQRTITEVKPSILVLNAGAIPPMAALDEQTWESFGVVWENDVKGGFVGIQAALKSPLAPGGRVLITSSGAATAGHPCPVRMPARSACRGSWRSTRTTSPSNETSASRSRCSCRCR